MAAVVGQSSPLGPVSGSPPMADGSGGGGGGEGGSGGGVGGEGRGGSSECLPMDKLLEAMMSNGQALAEALAADRARRETADRIQRESWEAALKEKDAEIDRLRAEAADTKKKLQADASRKMGWEAACDLLLNAAELRDADMEDSRTCAEPPNSKETESCTKLNQDSVDHIRVQLRKLEQDYETLSSKKDKEVSALLSEKDSVHKQLNIMQQDYTELLKSKKGLTQKKDHEIVILRAEAVGAKRKVQKMHSLVKEKDDEIQRLKGWNVESVQKHSKDISETHKKPGSGDPAVTVSDKLKQAYETLSSEKDMEVSALLSEMDSVRNQLNIMQQDNAELLKNKKVEAAQATDAALKLQKSVDELKLLAQKKDDEVVRLQAEAVEVKKKYDKDLCALLSEKDSVHNQLSIMQQNYTVLLKNKKILTQKKDHEIVILRSDAIGAKRKVQKMHSLVKEKEDEIQRLKGSQVESVDPAVTARDKLKASNLRQTVEEDYISEKKIVQKDGEEQTTQKRRRASSMSNDCEMSRSDEDSDEQSESDKDGGKQSERDEDGDKQSTSDKDGDEQSSQSGSDKERTKTPILKHPGNHKRKRDACNAKTANGKSHSESSGVVKRRSYETPPSPLLGQRLVTGNGRCSMISTGNWAQYVSDVKDSLAGQPDKRKEFDQFLRELKQGYIISYLARTMKDVLDGHPELTRRFNEFLPIHWQIELEKKSDEKSGSDEDDGEQSGSNGDDDEQVRNDEDGDEQGRSDDVDGQIRSDGPDNEQHGCGGDDDEQIGSDEETTSNQVQKPLGRARQATSQGPRRRDPPSPSDSALKKHGMKKPRGGGPRKALMQKLRDQIKGILLNNGWTIDLRPRKGRTYEDSVYVSPQGTGYWSITKAYAAYQEQLKMSQDEELISKDDLAMLQRTVRRRKSQKEHSDVSRVSPVRGRGRRVVWASCLGDNHVIRLK